MFLGMTALGSLAVQRPTEIDYKQAATTHFRLRLSRRGKETLPRAWRALKGWRKSAPGGSNLPMPLLGLHALVGAALYMKQPAFALAVQIAFWAYLRPGELLDLHGHQLVPPHVGKNLCLPFWGIIVRSLELGRASKVGEHDESVMLDVPSLAWSTPWLQLLRTTRHDKRIWPFSHKEYNTTFQARSVDAGVDGLGCPPYALRHGGASHDAVTATRSLAEIKARGRWRADASVRRYQKASRAQQQIHRLSDATIAYGELVGANLEAFMNNPSLVPAPPRLQG